MLPVSGFITDKDCHCKLLCPLKTELCSHIFSCCHSSGEFVWSDVIIAWGHTMRDVNPLEFPWIWQRVARQQIWEEKSSFQKSLTVIRMTILRSNSYFVFLSSSDGYTYERSAIGAWIEKGKRRSPMTNSILPSMQLTPNRTLKTIICRYIKGS